MVKTGWTIEDLVDQSAALHEAAKAVAASAEMASYNKVQAERLSILREYANNGNIDQLLAAEQMLLARDLELYAARSAFRQERNSIAAALKQLQEAKTCLKHVYNHADYKKIYEGFSSKHKKDDLPLDSFREFLASQAARLSNWLSDRGSEADKKILDQRGKNLGVILKLYIELQRAALGAE